MLLLSNERSSFRSDASVWSCISSSSHVLALRRSWSFWVAVCCSMLKCVGVFYSWSFWKEWCCSVLQGEFQQRVAFYRNVSQCVAVCCSALQLVTVYSPYSLLQCVAVCCSVLQCVAMRGSVLQGVAVCCSVTILCIVASQTEECRNGICERTSGKSWLKFLRCVAVWCSVMQCIAVCCRVLQSVAECCRVLQCVAERCGVLQWVQLVHLSLYCSPGNQRAAGKIWLRISQCVASVMQSVAVRCGAFQCVAVCCIVFTSSNFASVVASVEISEPRGVFDSSASNFFSFTLRAAYLGFKV